ncbi:UPF3 domain-containing protein [Pseudoscourfieldia marina]
MAPMKTYGTTTNTSGGSGKPPPPPPPHSASASASASASSGSAFVKCLLRGFPSHADWFAIRTYLNPLIHVNQATFLFVRFVPGKTNADAPAKAKMPRVYVRIPKDAMQQFTDGVNSLPPFEGNQAISVQEAPYAALPPTPLHIKDTFAGTILQDKDYKKFEAELNEPEALVSAEVLHERKAANENNANTGIVVTALMAYVQKKHSRRGGAARNKKGRGTAAPGGGGGRGPSSSRRQNKKSGGSETPAVIVVNRDKGMRKNKEGGGGGGGSGGGGGGGRSRSKKGRPSPN